MAQYALTSIERQGQLRIGFIVEGKVFDCLDAWDEVLGSTPFTEVYPMHALLAALDEVNPQLERLAVAIGVDPMTAFAAACPFNPDVDELDMAGALLDGPLEMVRCRTIDLEVPAEAEIVLEGYLLPERKEPDGPFGEYHG